MAEIGEKFQGMNYDKIAKSLSDGGVEIQKQANDDSEPENKTLSSKELEEAREVIAERAEAEKEVPPTKMITDAYKWSPRKKCVEISNTLFEKAVEKEGLTHLGKATRFENPADLPEGGELNEKPPKFWIKPIEVVHTKRGLFRKPIITKEQTNEMLVVCQVNDADNPEDITMVIKQVKHTSGKVEQSMLSATMSKAEFDRLAAGHPEGNPLDEDGEETTTSLEGRDLAKSVFLNGVATTDEYKNAIMPWATGMTLDEYNTQRDETLHLVPEAGLASETSAELTANFEGKYAELLQTLDQNIERIKKEKEAAQKALEERVKRFRDSRKSANAFNAYYKMDPENRANYARILIEDYGATQEMLDLMFKERKKRNKTRGSNKATETRQSKQTKQTTKQIKVNTTPRGQTNIQQGTQVHH
jgi:hypothetical protein